MDTNGSKNLGIQFVASFDDRAVLFDPSVKAVPSEQAPRSSNTGVRFFVAFKDQARRPDESATEVLDTLQGLFSQHEVSVQRLVKKLQGTIEELNQQNAELRQSLTSKDHLISRYHLDGPTEDEI